MFQSASLAHLVMCKGNTCHLWGFRHVWTHPILSVSVTLALDQQTVGSVPPVAPVVYVWYGDCRLSTGVAASKYQLSEYFHKALHPWKDGDTLGRHDKMKKIAFFPLFFFFFVA